MTTRNFYPNNLLFALLCIWSLQGISTAYGQTGSSVGIQPLLDLGGESIHSRIPADIQPLILPQEIERFLKRLEGTPPDWIQLQGTDITEQSERLFQFNRQRDTARADKHGILHRPVAFLWAGFLRQYLPDYKGFSIALGPNLTKTSWGIIRFKPVDLPDYLVAIPAHDLRMDLLARQKTHEHIELVVVCIGTLISDESLIYGFSHDGHHEGMILPVVSVQKIMYFLKPS
ncbi:MAG: hypothetical protein WD032_02370 [Nitrospirales bacterium]